MNNANNSAQQRAREIEMEMRNWLSGGLDRGDGRLAIFDTFGEPVNKAVIRTAIASGYAEPWFSSPMRPQWTVCRLTAKGRAAVSRPAKTRK